MYREDEFNIDSKEIVKVRENVVIQYVLYNCEIVSDTFNQLKKSIFCLILHGKM